MGEVTAGGLQQLARQRPGTAGCLAEDGQQEVRLSERLRRNLLWHSRAITSRLNIVVRLRYLGGFKIMG